MMYENYTHFYDELSHTNQFEFYPSPQMVYPNTQTLYPKFQLLSPILQVSAPESQEAPSNCEVNIDSKNLKTKLNSRKDFNKPKINPPTTGKTQNQVYYVKNLKLSKMVSAQKRNSKFL